MTIDADETRALPHACGSCTTRWNGSNTAHCGGTRGCHQTFTSPRGFDRHRRDGACVNPAEAGLVAIDRVGYTAWGYPADEDDLARLRALRTAA